MVSHLQKGKSVSNPQAILKVTDKLFEKYVFSHR